MLAVRVASRYRGSHMAHKAISLFTGAGGLDYGFEAAGFETAVALEMDKACCETLAANRPWPVICDDVNAVSTSQLLRTGGLEPEEASVLIGGPPCQPFSKSSYWASGDSRRLLDPRASTIGAYLRVLREARPRTFLMENVEGLGFKGKDEGLKLVEATLEDINREHGTRYRASVKVVNAADYGAPQLRRRLLVVGSRDGASFRFPDPTHGDLEARAQNLALKPHATAWDALHDLPTTLNEQLAVRGRWADLLPSIPEGQNYLWHTERGGGLPLFGWRTRFWCFLLKLAKDRPSWTIQAQPGPATGPFHWDNRRLSMRELCRLQTFPDDVQVLGSPMVTQKQLGNAVPSLLAEVIGREIRRQLFKERVPRSLKLAVQPASVPAAATGPKAVPAQYMALRGQHAAHPGTGLGPAAQRRLRAA